MTRSSNTLSRRAGAALLVPIVVLALGLSRSSDVRAASTLFVGSGGGSGECAAPLFSTIQAAVNGAASGDTVHICAGTYTLSASVTVPSGKDLIFVGDDAASTIITPSGLSRSLFWINSASVTVSDLTFQGGKAQDPGSPAGGAIYGNQIVAIRCRFISNSSWYAGGAIAGTGVTATGSTFSGNRAGLNNNGYGGGAINADAVRVTSSTFTDNTAPSFGGAIRSTGSAIANGSTFTGNGAGGTGGAIYAAPVTVGNSTFSGNSGVTSGGAIGSWGTVTATNATFSAGSGLGGAIKAANAVIANSIIAQTLPNACSAAVTDGGGNLATDGTCGLTQPTSKVVTLADLQLGALAANGGPTATIAIGATSGAIDAGLDTACSAAPVSGLDQRGVARPQGLHCDAGAYEAPSLLPGPPTGVTATAGNAVATVSWSAPASSGGSSITSYAVVSSPGGLGCSTGGSLSCTVGGLANGTPYTFVVTATNASGTGRPSSASAAVTPAGPAPTPPPATPTAGPVPAGPTPPSNGGPTRPPAAVPSPGDGGAGAAAGGTPSSSGAPGAPSASPIDVANAQLPSSRPSPGVAAQAAASGGQSPGGDVLPYIGIGFVGALAVVFIGIGIWGEVRRRREG